MGAIHRDFFLNSLWQIGREGGDFFPFPQVFKIQERGDAISKMKVLHRTGHAEDGEIIKKISLDTAKYVVILARDATDTKSDSLSFDILCRVREISKEAFIVVELEIPNRRQHSHSRNYELKKYP